MKREKDFKVMEWVQQVREKFYKDYYNNPKKLAKDLTKVRTEMLNKYQNKRVS